MAQSGQMLAFEPPHFGPKATIGGSIAAGLSGPRRPYAGAVRDLVLGIRLLDGRGDELAFGGRVMKNVAGFDVSRLDRRIARDAGRHSRGVAQVSAAAARGDDADFRAARRRGAAQAQRLERGAVARVGELLARWAPARAPVRRRQRGGGRGAAAGRRAARRRRELLGRGARPDACIFSRRFGRNGERTGVAHAGAVAAVGARDRAARRVRRRDDDRMGRGAALARRGGATAMRSRPARWAAAHGGHATLFRGRRQVAPACSSRCRPRCWRCTSV